MIKKVAIAFAGLAISLSALANTDNLPLFYAGAYGGYGNIRGAYNEDGNYAQGRAALGVLPFAYKTLRFGFEAGMQSGNTMRLSESQAVLDASGGLPVQSTLKPMIDLLLTLQAPFVSGKPAFYFLKGGAVYRQLQLNDRTSSEDDIRKVAPEFQAGLGYNLTKQIMLVTYYQGIYSSSNANVQVDSAGDTTISRIPTQQAGFLGVEYTF